MQLVKVTTTNLADNSQTVRIIDHDEREPRVWLGKHCFWAMRTKHKVETEPVEAGVAS